MEVRYIKPEEAADYQKISAASFIWKFNAEEDSKVEAPVLAAFNDGKLIACGNCDRRRICTVHRCADEFAFCVCRAAVSIPA